MQRGCTWRWTVGQVCIQVHNAATKPLCFCFIWQDIHSCVIYSASIMTKTTVVSAFWSAHFLAAWTTNDTDRENTANSYSYCEYCGNIFSGFPLYHCTIAILFTRSLHQKKENKNILSGFEVNNLSFLKSASNWDTCVWLRASTQRHCSVFFPFPLTPLMHTVRQCYLIKPQGQEKWPTNAVSNKTMTIKIVLLHLRHQLWCSFYHNTTNILYICLGFFWFFFLLQ